MLVHRSSSITWRQRLTHIGLLSFVFSLYAVATVFSMRYSYRDETPKDRLAFAAICVGIAFFLIYRRLPGTDIWVFATFVLFGALILVGALFNLVELITTY